MLYVPFSIYDFIKLANAKIGTNEPKLVTTEEDRGSLPTTQSVEVQTGISKTILRPGDLSLPKEKETVMEETTDMTAADPSVRLLTFLTHYDYLEFNSFPASHFHHFGPPYTNFV